MTDVSFSDVELTVAAGHGLATEAKQDDTISALGGTLTVTDRDDTLEVLTDQAGADAVLTFTFAASSQPWVYVDTGDPVRVTGNDQTPTASFGIPVASGSPFPIPVLAATLKVYAATGQTVSVYGTR